MATIFPNMFAVVSCPAISSPWAVPTSSRSDSRPSAASVMNNVLTRSIFHDRSMAEARRINDRFLDLLRLRFEGRP
jgi:hypothetical protein